MSALIATTPDSPAASYDTDFYAWTLAQAEALRAGRVSKLDIAHLAGEIEDLGKEIFCQLRSSLRVLVHMLKWDHQPEHRSHSWVSSIKTHRLEIEEVPSENYALRRRQVEAVAISCRQARVMAAGEIRSDERDLPPECPYTLDEILHRPFEWRQT